jgi:hypothetical protein
VSGRFRSLACAWVSLSLFVIGAGTAAAASWTSVPTPGLGARQGVLASVSCTSTAACVAVGYSYRDDPTVTALLIERWSGGRWRVQRAPLPRYVNQGGLFGVSCATADSCIAVGDVTGGGGTFPFAERWNGTRWKPQSVPRPYQGGFDEASLFGVICLSATACVAVGQDDDANVSLAERWNGRAWSVRRTPSAGDASLLTSVSCTAITSCAAVGNAEDTDSSGCFRPLTERLTGTRWSVEPMPALPACGDPDGAGLYGVSCTAATTCTAVGGYDRAGDAYERTLVERVRAGPWSIQPTPSVASLADPWGGGGYLYDVKCISPNACIAVGQVGSELRTIPIVEYGSASGWVVQPLGGGLTGGGLDGISCVSQTSCIAVGSAGTVTMEPLVERLQR